MTWRTLELLREGLGNLGSNAFRSLALSAIAAAALGGLAFMELRQAGELTQFARDYQSGGAYVAIASVPGGGLSGARCQALNGVDGVRAAGAMRGTGTVTFVSAPGVLFQSADVTPGLLGVWAPGVPGPSGAGILAGSALATELGIRAGLVARVDANGPTHFSAVYDFSRRNPQAARWALSPVPAAGAFDECWVEFSPGSYQGGKEMLAARFAEGSADPVVRPYRRSDEFTRNPAAEWASRPQQRGWIAVPIVLFGLGLVSAWFRRSESALYLAMGTRRAQLAVMASAEQWPLIGVGWALGFTVAFTLQAFITQQPTADSVRAALTTSVSGALLSLALLPWASALVARGSIANMLKDR